MEFGGLCGTRVFLQGCAGSFSGTSRTITSWYKRELKTRALCMATHKSMHQLVFHRNCGHSANLWLFVRLFFPGPSRPNVETLYSCKFEVLPHSAPNGARASPRFQLLLFRKEHRRPIRYDLLLSYCGPTGHKNNWLDYLKVGGRPHYKSSRKQAYKQGNCRRRCRNEPSLILRSLNVEAQNWGPQRISGRVL